MLAAEVGEQMRNENDVAFDLRALGQQVPQHIKEQVLAHLLLLVGDVEELLAQADQKLALDDEPLQMLAQFNFAQLWNGANAVKLQDDEEAFAHPVTELKDLDEFAALRHDHWEGLALHDEIYKLLVEMFLLIL